MFDPSRKIRGPTKWRAISGNRRVCFWRELSVAGFHVAVNEMYHYCNLVNV